MPEVRERKNSDKIKGKSDKKSGSVKKDVRRQMTAKYVKELTQRQRNRDTSGSTDTAPEVQAAEQVEEMIYTTADSLRERTADAVSKSISRHKQKQQKKKGRTEQPPGETPPRGRRPRRPRQGNIHGSSHKSIHGRSPPAICGRAPQRTAITPPPCGSAGLIPSVSGQRPPAPARIVPRQRRPRKSGCGRPPLRKNGTGRRTSGAGPPVPQDSGRPAHRDENLQRPSRSPRSA